MAEMASRSDGSPRRTSSADLHFGGVIAFAGAHDEVFAAFYPQVHRVVQAVGLQGFRPVEDVVLMAQLVGDVLKRLIEIFHFEREEGAAAGFLSQVPED